MATIPPRTEVFTTNTWPWKSGGFPNMELQIYCNIEVWNINLPTPLFHVEYRAYTCMYSIIAKR
jgi:hypothetical protein